MSKRLLALAVGVAFATAISAVGASAAGIFPGFPSAGFPLTGNETIPGDTNLSNGQNPQTELITPGQLKGYFRATSTVTPVTAAGTGTGTTTGATAAIDASLSGVYTITLTGNDGTQFNTPSNLSNGETFALIVFQDATGGRTATWPGIWQFSQSAQTTAPAAPTLGASPGFADLFTFVYNGTNLMGTQTSNVESTGQ